MKITISMVQQEEEEVEEISNLWRMSTCQVKIEGLTFKKIYRVSKKTGISDLTCVGWLLAMLTGHMIPFWNPWDHTSALGVIT